MAWRGQIVLEWKVRTLKLRVVPGRSKCRQPKTPNGGATDCPLPEDWRPSPEDETFARRHGMNSKGVTHAIRTSRWSFPGPRAGRTDDSAIFRAWIVCHAIEAPHYFPISGNVVSHGPVAPI